MSTVTFTTESVLAFMPSGYKDVEFVHLPEHIMSPSLPEYPIKYGVSHGNLYFFACFKQIP